MGHQDEPVPIRWAGPVASADSDRRLDRDLRGLCEAGKGVTPELARDVLFWLDLGQSPRDVAHWLRIQLEEGPGAARYPFGPLHGSLYPADASTTNVPPPDAAPTALDRDEESPSPAAGQTDPDAMVPTTKRRRRVRRIFGRRRTVA